MSIISAKDLCLWYGNFQALKNINIEIPEHTITALIGPSGCGKSTFLKTLNRMNDLIPTVKITGEVMYNGQNIFETDVNNLRKEVGMVFQKPNPFPMSIYDNIAYGPRTHGITNKVQLDDIVEKALRSAAIWDEVKDRLKKNALGMSGGQQQRLCIARALAVEPKVLLMDEPTSALDRGHGSVIQELEGRTYRFDMSSIQSDGNLLGAVILAVDVTESQNAEQMRREFSANVSHELKTPLQGIIGSAELLESGMVKQEDTSRFVGHIRKESSRLVNLIEDIIRLSQLDEGVELPAEQVDMLQLAEDIKEILEPSAAEKQVSISVSGLGFTVMGVRRMLHEVVYNLCDNAIKYNVPGGSVTICVENNRLVVSDTGIGIPAEHKDRIFERFYRVDKSHSKASGGTGLDLSIVKHAAAYHKAEISLESTPGKGTTIAIQF